MIVTDIMGKYAKALDDLPFSIGDAARIYLKRENRCFATVNGAEFSGLKEWQVEDITDKTSVEKDVLMKSKEYDAMIVCRAPYTSICIDAKKPIPAVLDDMAQIVGRRVCLVPNEVKTVEAALKKATAVMISPEDNPDGTRNRDGYVITAGRNLYEAYVTLMVLEKSAEVILKASVIGGAKPLGALECKVMRQFYKRKYSKKETAEQDVLEGEG